MSTALEDALVASRERLFGFIRSKVSDPQVAEDILQDALLKALRARSSLRDEESIAGWFRGIVNHAIVDSYRSRAIRDRRTEPLAGRDFPEVGVEEESQLCECFRALVPTLKPEYEALVLAELDEEPGVETASRLGITSNNLKVRRHRARQALKARLEETCRTCAVHGCLDCTCEPVSRRGEL